jgi:hypothetical protein
LEREAREHRISQHARDGRSANLKHSLGRQMVRLGERLQS